MNRILYIVRHAQSQPSDEMENSLWPLSDVGKAQAQALAPLLIPLGITRLFSSPYERTLATIRPFSDRSGLKIHVRDGLHERKIVHLRTDDFAAVWARSWEDHDYAIPGCESNKQAQARMIAAVHGIISECDDAAIAVCSHGAVLTLLLNRLDSTVGRSVAEELRNPDIIKILVDGENLVWDRSYELPGLADIATGYPG